MHEPLVLSIEVLFRGVRASIVDPNNKSVIDSAFAPMPEATWNPPMQLKNPAHLRGALAAAIGDLSSPLPKVAVVAYEPTFSTERASPKPGAGGYQDDADAAAAAVAEAAALDDDFEEVVAVPVAIGSGRYYYGADASAIYLLADYLLGRRIDLRTVVPIQLAAFAHAFPDGLNDGAWAFVSEHAAYVIAMRGNRTFVGSRALPPDDSGVVQTIFALFQAAKMGVSSSGAAAGLDFFVSAPNADQLIGELSQKLGATVAEAPCSPAVGATLLEEEYANLVPETLRPRPLPAAARLSPLLVALALLLAFTLSAKIALETSGVEGEVARLEQELADLQPYLDAQRRFEASIAQTRRLLEAFQAAERHEIHWSQEATAPINRVVSGRAGEAVTLESVDFQLDGPQIVTKLSGTAEDETALLALLNRLNTPPFELNFRSTTSQEGGFSFSVSTRFPLNRTAPNAEEVNRAE